MPRTMRFGEAGSGLSARADLLDDKAPASRGYLWRYLERLRGIPAICHSDACLITLEQSGA